MLATATLNGYVMASEYFSNPYDGIQWLIRQRSIRSVELSYRLETLDGYIFYDLALAD